MSSFENVLVVGANRGIGLGLVEEVLKISSAKVFATARQPDKAFDLIDLGKKYPGRVVILKADMLDEPSLKAAASELSKHSSVLDVAILNAGIVLGQGNVEDLTAEDLLENLRANIVGPHNLFKVFTPFVVASKVEKKTIAVISSVVGSLGALPMVNALVKQLYSTDQVQVSGYSATKSGVNMLARQWADKLEPLGVAVPLIHPGVVATEMNKEGGDLIPVSESAEGIISIIDKLDIATTGTGILSYDGSVIPW